MHTNQRISPVHKLIYYLLYIDRPDIFTKQEGLSYSAKLSPLAKALNTTNYRLKDYFCKLEELGVITQLTASYGEVEYYLCVPHTFKWILNND